MYIMLISWAQILPLVLFKICCHAQPELFTTLIRMPSIKSQSLSVPSVEQEYACNKQEHIGHYFSKHNLLAIHCKWLRAYNDKLLLSGTCINYEVVLLESVVTVPAGGYRGWGEHRSPGLCVPGGCGCTPRWRCWTLLRILPKHTTGTCIHKTRT